ncbi:hypothetical protein L218DRAFT_1081583 [Marasmius fiardii PR-910]|nr:hypothetical protein L218DRAFT_1081583 [Marasmius fiardii PR-910]
MAFGPPPPLIFDDQWSTIFLWAGWQKNASPVSSGMSQSAPMTEVVSGSCKTAASTSSSADPTLPTSQIPYPTTPPSTPPPEAEHLTQINTLGIVLIAVSIGVALLIGVGGILLWIRCRYRRKSASPPPREVCPFSVTVPTFMKRLKTEKSSESMSRSPGESVSRNSSNLRLDVIGTREDVQSGRGTTFLSVEGRPSNVTLPPTYDDLFL